MQHLKEDMEYYQLMIMVSKKFNCGYCGSSISSEKGFNIKSNDMTSKNTIKELKSGVYICHSCQAPTFFSPYDGKQYPGAVYGEMVKNLSKELESAYNEARDCFKVSAYTASALMCRKILMHLACDLEKEAIEGESFKYYINLLIEKNHLTNKLKPMAEHIRGEGNTATHKLEATSKESSEKLIKFVEVLLKINYEYVL
ncbi:MULTISPECIES: DUF4145 domain-containing protein [Psychrilyobacter]|uniref:DUF4145 domain-containing protein n=1 Tax=Psychrilyobacter piezotolerans TaxID=2293438 RepID=A0ABX9KDB8_9FUSO|nr:MULTISPECIES: DUF4145 domain-containing protein [Psychrilyobacter]MCS5423203.1 DUF4145 domain-containing protein [Psychrilyobacter sp. S5]NDI77873.1 DUF4145 domain-containing protein [Psychrilyobacter piezotolerans]RDE58770.1 DUF4145 domain-containing protein [Psychrilyobacter sp. S5]REI39244.1 DUF4145 domain-containing protein [Psychrilyobacter piezotolerans]